MTKLIMNNNPLEVIPPEINRLSNLRKLGIANTLVRQLPIPITELTYLKDIYVYGCPL